MGGHVSAVVLKLAGRCNLNCSYCYVYNHEDKGFLSRPKFIDDTTYDQTLQRMAEYCERRQDHTLDISFHGGEPTLIGAQRFADLVARAREVLGAHLGHLSIQTNGTLIDDEWVDVLRTSEVHVGVSFDGPREIHDASRVDHQGRGSYDRVLRGFRRLQEAGLEPYALCVINPALSGGDVYRHFRSMGIRAMNFLLPDVGHHSKERFYGGLGPTPVADYLIPIFDAWMAEDDPEVSVQVFKDLLIALFEGLPTMESFGNPKMGYLIVETDGSIEAMDALRVCEEGLGKSQLHVAQHGFDDLADGLPLVHRLVHERIPLCGTCRRCPEVEICGGGFLPHRFHPDNGFDNPSVWCQDIQKILAHMREVAHGRHAA